MTTLAELVDAAPDAAAGVPVDIAFGPGGFRFVCEIADPSAGTSVEWYDITEHVAGYRLERGAQSYAGRYRAAVAVLELVSDDDEFAPWNEDTSGTFGTHVDLGAGLLIRAGFIRVVAGAVVGHRPRFTNRVESWSDDSAARGNIRRHTIVSRDLLTDLVNVPIPATLSENWYDRVDQVLSDAGWSFGSNVYGAQQTSAPADILTLPARSAAGNALAELDATIDPAGCVLYTNTKGQIVIRPQPGDTFHADAFTAGASGDEWTDPATVTFSYLADGSGGLAAYAADGVDTPFGFDSTELGLINRLVITDTGTYDIDDPTSIARFGYRPKSATWQADNDAVADDILDRLKNATVEARPLTTTIDLPGFMSYVAALEYLDPITIVHQTKQGRSVVTGDGYVRSLVENVTPAALTGGLDWSLQIVGDIESTDEAAELVAPTNLAATAITDTGVTFTWTNPTQTITPTDTQVRLSGSSIWLDEDYPITSYPWAGLRPSTPYEFEVRYVKRTNGVITNASAAARVEFTTLATTVPVPDGPVTGGYQITLPDPDTGCDVEWVLEETDLGGGDDDIPADTAVKATGGTAVWDATAAEWVHTFTASGTFALITAGTLPVDFLVVGGGGGGGGAHGQAAGGGGGGDVVPGTAYDVTTAETVTVGAGGTGGASVLPPTAGTNGGSSSFAGSTAAGGGYGGGTSSTNPSGHAINGASGGSGGGGGGSNTTLYSTPGTGTGTNANAGGSGLSSPTGYPGDRNGGGGGGAGAVGGAANTSGGGVGGAGYEWPAASGTYYGGGASGASADTADNQVAGGVGGGGKGGGADGVATAGTAGTGGGGGGGKYFNRAGDSNGAAGGSGVVIVRYDPTAFVAT